MYTYIPYWNHWMLLYNRNKANHKYDLNIVINLVIMTIDLGVVLLVVMNCLTTASHQTQ